MVVAYFNTIQLQNEIRKFEVVYTFRAKVLRASSQEEVSK